MRLPSEKLESILRRGLQPLIIVLGEEPLLAFEALDTLRKAAHQQGYTTREVLTVEPGFEWGSLPFACNSSSLFGDKKLVELRIPSGKPGAEGARHLETLGQLSSQDTLILISLPALDYRTQQSVWFKALESTGLMIVAMPVTRDRLPAWIAHRLALQQQKATPETLAFLTGRVEGHLLAAHQEILKLGLLFPPGILSPDAVRDAVLNVARHDIHDLASALITGDLARFVRTLRGLQAEGEALPLVLWAIVEDLRALNHLITAQRNRRSLSAACREARIWGPRQKLLESLVARTSPGLCEAALVMAARVDRTIKGVEDGDPWDTLLALGLQWGKGSGSDLKLEV
ncbi:MAG: DNA polymerase III subunit delta [Betaproteobacteria bacterium]|nr:DNA polymerase III subunit delta [Betaproteobacteria bacterium]